VPETIHSDNGKQFTSKAFEEMIDGFGIQHIKTLIYEYSPQSNAVERVSRNVLAAIRSFLDRDHQEWDGICLGVYHAIASVIWKEKKVYERLIESCVASRYVWAPRKVPFELLGAVSIPVEPPKLPIISSFR